ncbi:hypothetical protein BIW11_04292 [Tropilaelaps mercedesae]|uniref:Uncharacterized protein n=1 Tax=Tropilaelaps mercedesae TaxID=418985 RepID=A0A1V9X8Y7_9ACAR|nr:hypothetical protein BIW11_04292 [Tropilaelaps mercedesae]
MDDVKNEDSTNRAQVTGQ